MNKATSIKLFDSWQSRSTFALFGKSKKINKKNSGSFGTGFTLWLEGRMSLLVTTTVRS